MSRGYTIARGQLIFTHPVEWYETRVCTDGIVRFLIVTTHGVVLVDEREWTCRPWSGS